MARSTPTVSSGVNKSSSRRVNHVNKNIDSQKENRMSKVANVNSSLAYEILLYLNSFYLGMFFVCEIAMGILKAINVSYPENALLTEAGIFSALCLVEVIRIFLGRRGNLETNSMLFIYFLIFFCYGCKSFTKTKPVYNA